MVSFSRFEYLIMPGLPLILGIWASFRETHEARRRWINALRTAGISAVILSTCILIASCFLWLTELKRIRPETIIPLSAMILLYAVVVGFFPAWIGHSIGRAVAARIQRRRN